LGKVDPKMTIAGKSLLERQKKFQKKKKTVTESSLAKLYKSERHK
jgi:hypothetical protein